MSEHSGPQGTSPHGGSTRPAPTWNALPRRSHHDGIPVKRIPTMSMVSLAKQSTGTRGPSSPQSPGLFQPSPNRE